jgi:hypothetical protein
MSDDNESTPNEPTPPIAAPPLPRRRFQFSLATLIWLTTVVACIAAVWAMYRDLQKAKADLRAAHVEVSKYRGEMGYLDVVDPGKVYARSHRKLADFKWSWRLYLPESKMFHLCTAEHQLPAKDLPSKDYGWEPLDPGEHLIEASLDKTPEGQWYLHLVIDGSSSRSLRFALDNFTAGCSEEAEIEPQLEVDPGSPVVLLRLRKTAIIDGLLQGVREPCDGFMIWIEEDKETSPAPAKPQI